MENRKEETIIFYEKSLGFYYIKSDFSLFD